MKPYLSCIEQVELLRSRGLEITDADECATFLEANNYYRFSGYARYFQQAPHLGGDDFRPGISFNKIRGIYRADEALRHDLLGALGGVELLLRAHFAGVVADQYGPYEEFLSEGFYLVARRGKPTHESCLEDIRRSQEFHITRHKIENHREVDYRELPVWSAVEVWSFGTLSKAIERGARGELAKAIAASVGVAREGFASRVKALVYLRNRCAHHSRLWHHSMIDAGATPNNLRGRAKRLAGQFSPQSVMDAIASLDDVSCRGGVAEPLLPLLVERGRENASGRGSLTRSRPVIIGPRSCSAVSRLTMIESCKWCPMLESSPLPSRGAGREFQEDRHGFNQAHRTPRFLCPGSS
ncbi:MAG: Abi family protein [Angustibacter sp.]